MVLEHPELVAGLLGIFTLQVKMMWTQREQQRRVREIYELIVIEKHARFARDKRERKKF
jgi:hypothetical protein